MFAPDPADYVFGPYRLKSHHGLYRRGEYVPLPPKELAVLCALVSRCGHVVSKEQLIAEVWPRDFVSDESLARCIYVLRRTLGPTDEGDESYIQTVYRRGYRFAAPVSLTNVSQHPAPAPSEKQQAALEQCRLGFGRLCFGSRGDVEQAVFCFQRALDHDALCALAYAGLGEATIIQAGRGWMPVEAAREMLRDMADVGRQFNPASGEVFAVSAMVAAMFEWNWTRAEAEAQRAVQLGGDYKASLARGSIALCLGRTDEAVEHLKTAVEQGPYVPHCHDMLTWCLFAHGDHDGALRQARRAVEMLPSVTSIFQAHAAVAGYLELHDEAIAAARRSATLSDREPHGLTALVRALYAAGHDGEACDVYAEILRYAANHRFVWSYIAPEVLLVEGPDCCLDALEQAAADRCCILPIKLTDPRLRVLENEPRFQAVRRSVLGPKMPE